MTQSLVSLAVRPLIKWWTLILGISALAAMTVVTVGVPSLLLLAGTWSFAALFNRWRVALSGPTSWAAGLVAEVTLLLALSGMLALVYPHRDPQWVYVITLLIPLVVAAGGFWRLTSTSNSRVARRTPTVSAEPYLVIVCVILLEAMFEAVKLRGHFYGVTWFMGGDGRNHVLANRAILDAGGITLHEMSTYPALFNALAAIVDGAGGRANVSAGVLLVRDVQAMTAMVIMSCAAIAMFFIAAVVEMIPRSDRDTPRLPLYLWIPLGACGSIAVGAFVLSLAASGGFFSAIGCLALALASLVLGLRIAQRYDHVTLILLTMALVLVVGSWTLLGVVPALAMVAGYLSGVRQLIAERGRGDRESSRLTLGVIGVSVACWVGVIGVLAFERSKLIPQFKLNGGIVGPNPRLFYWLGIVIVAVVILAPSTKQRVARLLLLTEFGALLFTVSRVRSLHPAGADWSYYATKTIWLATALLLWTPFILLVDVMRLTHRFVRTSSGRVVANLTISLVGSTGALWGIGHETPFTFPLAWAWFGSTIPSPQEIELVAHEADRGGPFVIWDYSTPFEDKLGNFWSALTWDYRSNGTEQAEQGPISFVNWAAQESGLPSDLCEIVSHYRLRIVTRNPTLVAGLQKSCPGYLPASAATTMTARVSS